MHWFSQWSDGTSKSESTLGDTFLLRLTVRGRYREAFLACRKHRLDLNILYDLAPSQFMENLSKFVEAVPEVDYLNLFVSALKYVT